MIAAGKPIRKRKLRPIVSDAELFMALPWRSFAAAMVFKLLIGLAALFVIRRLMGELAQPLTAARYLLLVLPVVGAASFVRRTFRPAVSLGALAWPERLRHESATLVAIVFALAIWLPGTPPGALALAALVMIADRLSDYVHWPRRRLGLFLPEEIVVEGKSFRVSQPRAANWSQQCERFRTASGVETCETRLRVEFAAGQKNTSVHIAFCPAFAQLPEVTHEQTSGPAAQIKLGQLLPVGVRLDLKLSQAGPAVIELKMTATEPQQPA